MPPIVVFDVESVGLHGPAFAVGAVVMTPESVAMYRRDDTEHPFVEEFYVACSLPALEFDACIDYANYDWCMKNVWPALPQVLLPNERAVRDAFWEFWRKWADRGAVLMADCGWPVEANFLSACIADDHRVREYEGPYPLLDLSTLLWRVGHNPTDTFDRQLHELPAHNPLMDARQSARILTWKAWGVSSFDDAVKAMNEQGLADAMADTQ